MRQLGIALGVAVLAAGGACIDFDSAELSFCNQVRLDHRIGMCGSYFVGDPARFNGAIYSVNSYGAEGNEQAEAAGIAQGGFIWTGGHFDGTADFGTGRLASAGAGDGFVVQFSPGGVPNWTRRLGGPGEDAISAVRILEPDAAVLGTFEGPTLDLGGSFQLQGSSASSAFVAELRALDGVTTAARVLTGTPGARVVGRDLGRLQGLSGSVAVGAITGGSMVVDGQTIASGSQETFWAVGLDSASAYQWHASTTGCDFSSADHAVLLPGGIVIVSGRAQGTGCKLGSTPLLSGRLEGVAYAFLARFDPRVSGAIDPTWIRVLGPTPRASQVLLASDPAAGPVALSAILPSAGEGDGLSLVRLQQDGGDGYPPVTFTAPAVRGLGLAVSNTGRAWVTGGFDGDTFLAPGKQVPVLAGPNAFTVEVDPSGQVVWARSFHSDVAIEGRAMAWDATPFSPFNLERVGPVMVGRFQRQIDVELPTKYIPAPGSGEALFLFRFYPALEAR